MDEFTEARYSRLADRYIEKLESQGMRVAVEYIYDEFRTDTERVKKFLPFLKRYAKTRGYYV